MGSLNEDHGRAERQPQPGDPNYRDPALNQDKGPGATATDKSRTGSEIGSGTGDEPGDMERQPA